ncbi:helix-turn-helix domain-containing protein [Archangium gephyra]|uniref:helix-turn-helix domain-containing protein n=1 Tax=Archangium gephyra TaxID=48 RepID=UPI0035D406A0
MADPKSPVSASEQSLAEVVELARFMEGKRTQRPRLVGPRGETLELPEPVFHLLRQVVTVLARGDAVTVVPVHKELTSQQAADLLNVSRQYLVRLLDEGALPYTKTGMHRRIRINDLLEYKKKRDAQRKAGLSELMQMSQDFGGYSECS